MKTRIVSVCLIGLGIVLTMSVLHNIEAAEVSNRSLHWGFTKSKNHTSPEVGKEFEELLQHYDSYYLGDPTTKKIYLTFDNGYENGFTADILNVLEEKNVPATFFVTGHYLKSQPDLVRRMVNEGHIVGNHSWHHPDLTTKTYTEIKNELSLVENEFNHLTGKNGMNYLRAPRGIFSERTLAFTQEMGYRNIFWSLAFIDWHIDQQKGWEYAYDNIMDQIHPGAILLLHTVSQDNAEALPKAIDDLREEGYVFKSLDDLVISQGLEEPNLFQMR